MYSELKTATQPQKASNQTPLTPSCLSKCEDLIFETFIQIMEDGDHSRLGGGDTQAAWDTIRNQYEQIVGGNTYSAMVILLGELNRLAVKIKLIETVTTVMRTYYVPTFGELLANYGYKYTWALIPDEQYQQQLDSVISRSKTLYIAFKAKEREWKNMTADSGKKTDISYRQYFEDWLIGISEEQGYHLRSTTLTTYQFALLYRKSLEARRKARQNK